MLVVEFSRSEKSMLLTSFDLGHVSVSHGPHKVTSEARSPDQSCMVFLTATLALDTVSKFLTGPQRRQADVVAVDSSFRITLTPLRLGGIALGAGGEAIGEVSPTELVRAVFHGAATLLNENPLPAGAVARDDLEAALRDFGAMASSIGVALKPDASY